MSPGKQASQAGHAFLDAYLAAQEIRPDVALEYRGDSHGTKVVLRAKNQEQLLRAFEKAKAAGIPCALIIDSGHVMPPHFTGDPIVTALGIGPATRSEVARITGSFALAP